MDKSVSAVVPAQSGLKQVHTFLQLAKGFRWQQRSKYGCSYTSVLDNGRHDPFSELLTVYLQYLAEVIGVDIFNAGRGHHQVVHHIVPQHALAITVIDHAPAGIYYFTQYRIGIRQFGILLFNYL